MTFETSLGVLYQIESSWAALKTLPPLPHQDEILPTAQAVLVATAPTLVTGGVAPLTNQGAGVAKVTENRGRLACLVLKVSISEVTTTVPVLVGPFGTTLHATGSLFEEPSFAGDTLNAVAAGAGLTAEVTALTRSFVLVLAVVAHRTAQHTGAVWEIQARGKRNRKIFTNWLHFKLCFKKSKHTQEETGLVAAEALVFGWPRTTMTGPVTLVALTNLIHV